CDTGHLPGHVPGEPPGTHALPGSTQAQSANVELPVASVVAWQARPSLHVPPHTGYWEPMQGVTPAGRHWPPMPRNSSGHHWAPGPQLPLHAGKVSPQAVGTLLVVVDEVVVVVPATAQPVPLQASQQLGNADDPTHAWPPPGAVHDVAERLMLHLVVPPGFD